MWCGVASTAPSPTAPHLHGSLCGGQAGERCGEARQWLAGGRVCSARGTPRRLAVAVLLHALLGRPAGAHGVCEGRDAGEGWGVAGHLPGGSARSAAHPRDSAPGA